MQYLNKRGFEALKTIVLSLVNTDEDASFDLDEIKKISTNFVAYATMVDKEAKDIEDAKATKSGEVFREFVKDIDERRHSAHNAAIVNCNLINKFAEIYNAPKICYADLAVRTEVTTFCLEFKEVFGIF